MKTGICVVLEHREGKVRRASLEALSCALEVKSKRSGEVHALLLGQELEAAAAEAAALGCDKVWCVENEALSAYSTEAHAAAVLQALNGLDCGTVMLASSVLGRDLGPALAARLDGAYAAECTRVDVQDGDIVATRPVYAGKAWATVKAKTEPFVIGLRPNVFAVGATAGAAAPLEKMAAEIAADLAAARVTGEEARGQGKLDVAEAEIVVSGGRGVGGPEGFAPLEELAGVLGAAVGASRAVVDLGWRPHAEQVGQTGKVVSPKLYFAIGISGAIQHLAGMRTSGTIVAINKDAEAPIFKVADLGIVGDLFEVVPALTTALREELAKRS